MTLWNSPEIYRRLKCTHWEYKGQTCSRMLDACVGVFLTMECFCKTLIKWISSCLVRFTTGGTAEDAMEHVEISRIRSINLKKQELYILKKTSKLDHKLVWCWFSVNLLSQNQQATSSSTLTAESTPPSDLNKSQHATCRNSKNIG